MNQLSAQQQSTPAWLPFRTGHTPHRRTRHYRRRDAAARAAQAPDNQAQPGRTAGPAGAGPRRNDMWGVIVRNGHAEKVKPTVAWPGDTNT
ncbi:hypothetical protein [Streptomyces sp. NPDC015125]|uniref:hypothetical protein n=1 Tax=Streptomyces sp. NPDC015125 TaxID=3364938 RepID=UPI0036F9F3E3